MKIIYRISDSGFNKIKPSYVNNENCLQNALKAFSIKNYDWLILADSINVKTMNMILKYVSIENIENINIKNGPGYPFMHILDKLLLNYDDKEQIYFIENDYIHKFDADVILKEGFTLGADYITLYDHPDKYINATDGGNPFIEGGGEVTQVFLTESCHWKLTNSTTGTFAATIKTLREDYEIIKKYANNPYWNDFHMFCELRNIGRTLISPIPGYATHGETAWLSPLTNWGNII